MALSKKEQKYKEKSQIIVDKFNRQYPIGSTVMHKKTGIKSVPFEARKTKTLAFLSGSNDPVAFLEGLSGYYCITEDFIDYSFKES